MVYRRRPATKGEPAALEEDEPRQHFAQVVGQLHGEVEHAAKDIEPDRLKFIGKPEFDPVPFLDYANREQYLRPLDHCFVDDLRELDLPEVKVRCSKSKQLELVQKLDEVTRLALIPGRFVRRQLLNGMFCLPKDQHRDRMILDARRPHAAMGDANAVAYGQVAHLSVILRSGQFRLCDFLTLKQRPGRQVVSCGLMIDDFVIFERTDKKLRKSIEEKSFKTEGRIKMEAVRRAYDEAKLPRHEGKAVEQSYDAEFWGLQVDGKLGQARPSLKRLVPLAWTLLKVVQVGLVSGNLLEVLAGALVSAFQCRRRLMCCLEEIYTHQRGVEPKDIIKMSTSLKDELLVCVGMLPLTVIDLRLTPSNLLICSDASSTAEAAVASDVGAPITKEFQRYGLQKGLWNRLLRPVAAYQRETDALSPDDELPEEESYKMNALWATVVKSCKFEQFGPVKHASSRRHINIKEMVAALRAEEKLGIEQPCSYYVHLQDGQVSLAALILRFVLELCKACLKAAVIFWVENPDQSWFWKQRGLLS